MQLFSYKIIFIVVFIALVFVYVVENRTPTQNPNYESQPTPIKTDTNKQTFSIESKLETPPTHPAQQSRSTPAKKETPPPVPQPPIRTKTDLYSQKLLPPPVATSVPSTTLPISPYAPIGQNPTPYIPSFQDPRQYVKSVVQLRCPNIINPSQIISGSGTIIDSTGYILTNRHLILGFDFLASTFYAGRDCIVYVTPSDNLYTSSPKFIARLVATLSDYDAALLRIIKDKDENIVSPPFDFSPLIPNIAIPKAGDRVFTIGYPAASFEEFHITTGLVIDVVVIDGQNMIKIDALISAGNSGGALLDSNGRFIGIPTERNKAEAGGYALEVRDIIQWINSVVQNTKNLSTEEIISRPVDISKNPL